MLHQLKYVELILLECRLNSEAILAYIMLSYIFIHISVHLILLNWSFSIYNFNQVSEIKSLSLSLFN